jgi:hypothetical protein
VQYKIDRLREDLERTNNAAIIESIIESPIPSSPIPEKITKYAVVREFESDGTIHYTILRDKLHRLSRKVKLEMSTERTGEPRFGEILSEVYFEGSRYVLGMLIETPTATSSFHRKGPPVTLKDAAEKFRKSHSEGIFESDGFLYIKEKREWTIASKLFDHVIENNPIEGLKIRKDKTKLSNQVLHVLHDYILPIEPEFRERMTRVKE